MLNLGLLFVKAFIIIKNTQNTEYQRKGIVTTEMKDALIMRETKSFGDFYKSFGLKDYPFNLYTAENETAYLVNLFIQPLNYDEIKSSFEGNRSIIIRGNRGTGKTALLLDLEQNAKAAKALTCVIDDYSELSMKPTLAEYYNVILVNLVSSIFYRLFDEKDRMKKLNKDDKLFLSLLLNKYTNQVTRNELIRKIEAIQLSAFTRFIKGKINFIRAVMNYGLTAGANFVNDVIRSYYSFLPPIQESEIRDILPKFNIEAETDFNSANSSYKVLLQVCGIIKKLGYEKVTVFFDKFDEDSRMESNAEVISEFICPLLIDNKLLENSDIQLVISVWEVPFLKIIQQVRTQKHFCPQLSWSTPKLTSALNKRIAVFSDRQSVNFRNMFADDVSEEDIRELFYLSNRNPRDLWHIFNRIFQSQYALDNSSTKLTKESIAAGLNDFVMNFNFYEYYPRKAKAKSNTMDIYSYIKHLLKLPGERFTRNQLSDLAGTGGSTQNYVVGMENIGLVAKTNEKQNGGVVYQICDPKVIYAIRKGIDISK